MKTAVLFCLIFVGIGSQALAQGIFDAIEQGDVETAMSLVEKNPGLVDSLDADGLTPLHQAAARGNAELVNFLIDKGAKTDPPGDRKTPLQLAAQNDCVQAAAALIERGAILEARDSYGRTALVLCGRERGQLGTARVLVEAGADVNAKDKFGDTALNLAAWRGKRELVDYLLEKGAFVPTEGQRWGMAVYMAASKGLTNLFRRLTEGEQDPKLIDPSGEFLLQGAAGGGDAEIVGLLLDRGFSPARADRLGWTPLHYAALNGRTDAARILVERGAPVDARTIMGQTPYNVAQERVMKDVVTLLAEEGADTSAVRFPVLRGDYLGQKPPAGKPELFGPGIVSSIWGLHSTAVFSPDGNEVYWAPMVEYPGDVYSRGGLLMMKRENGLWTAPDWAPFSGPDYNDDVPFFSQDGERLYFISRRPLPGETDGAERIWFVDRSPSGWSEPRPLDDTVNSQQMHWQFSLDGSGNVYFASSAPGGLGMDDVYVARFSGGSYEKPVNLGEPINSAGPETAPFIAPDGRYLLYSREFDLWVSFREPGGEWSAPVNLGPEVNSPEVELCPVVTPDGKYLFFLSQRDGESYAYWVGTDVIEKARTKR